MGERKLNYRILFNAITNEYILDCLLWHDRYRKQGKLIEEHGREYDATKRIAILNERLK